MYDGIKKALGPTPNRPLPSDLLPGKLSWIKGISWRDGWNTTPTSTTREGIVSPLALDAVECLPSMAELDIKTNFGGAQ